MQNMQIYINGEQLIDRDCVSSELRYRPSGVDVLDVPSNQIDQDSGDEHIFALFQSDFSCPLGMSLGELYSYLGNLFDDSDLMVFGIASNRKNLYGVNSSGSQKLTTAGWAATLPVDDIPYIPALIGFNDDTGFFSHVSQYE